MPTATFYPDPHPESTSVDGFASREGVDQTFTSIRAGAGTNADDSTAASTDAPWIVASTTSSQYQILRRAFFLFDISSIPETAKIQSATFSVYGAATNTKSNQLGDPDWHLAASTPASNTAIASGDYGSIATTSFGNITYASFTASQYNNITLNASGIAHIQSALGGVVKFSGQLSWDINNNTTGLTWASAASSGFRLVQADQTGTDQDPKLVIVYTLGERNYFYFM